MPNNKQDLNQFGSAKPAQLGNPQHCLQCEAMLTDAIDGTLSAGDQALFDLHLLSCVTCSSMMADAQRGAAWLEMLKYPRPEPSAALLESILARTTGLSSSASTSKTHAVAGAVPYLVPSNSLLGRPSLPASTPYFQIPSNVLPFRNRVAASLNFRALGHTLLQPRLAMTAAMAFFSVALTLNLTGVKLGELRASDLHPASLKRSFSEANAHVVRYYDNLRVVYELESRVHDLQHSSNDDLPVSNQPSNSAPDDSSAKPAPKPADGSQNPKQNPDKQARPRPRSGTSQRDSITGANLRYVVAEAYAVDLISSPGLLPQLSVAALLLPGTPTGLVQEARLV